MSIDFTKPTATADRAQNLTDTKDTLVSVAKQLDDTTPTGVATGMIRWSTANNKWQKYNGSSWADLSSSYAINVTSLGGQVAANYLLKAGGTMTGFITLHAAPTADLHAATKKYADDKVAALNLASGSWTPTLYNFSGGTVSAAYYIRVGNIVKASVKIVGTRPTGTSYFQISLPVGTANFAGNKGGGSVSVHGGAYGGIVTTLDGFSQVECSINVPTTASYTLDVEFMYEIPS